MLYGHRVYATFQGGCMLTKKELTIGEVIQVSMASMSIMGLVKQYMTTIPLLVKIKAPAGRICEMLKCTPSIEPYLGSGKVNLKPERFEGRIEFQNVDFTFPTEPNKQILKSFSFTADPGQKVAFVGATGCGKSTSIKLIERYYNPTCGTILLDGRPIEKYDVHHLRRHMSVVAQDNILFSTTIRENIIYGVPKHQRDTMKDEEIEDACRRANAWEFICQFPRKFETYVGESGVKLSGGQKQRIAITRAIIRKPTILLLDEATSALDAKSESHVQQALDRMVEDNCRGCTIMIAHRLTTIRNCDKIIVMDNGMKVEEGSHVELLKIPIKRKNDTLVSGWYHDLWKTQVGEDTSNINTINFLKNQVAKLQQQLNLPNSTCELKRSKSFPIPLTT
eukprot:TRINITY_DN105_c0_g1_i3.p1 TRINITY_DN105_c0_g1~~TRINITY_DN105_c0_g1_i3.p1  ORF type:complete len:393 (+),score=52.50 TRINITY_DN105_c0_g1_i3:1535-2713(+)